MTTIARNHPYLPLKNQPNTHIAHIGFGAFHRGHQAYYTHKINQLTGEPWKICVISLFSGKKIIEDLRNQNYQFSVLEKGNTDSHLHVIESVSEAIHPDHMGIEGLIHRLADSEIKIISLTLTEKGYCALPQSGALDTENKLIIHDLANPRQPKSAIGVLVATCWERMQGHGLGLTILSCDNVSKNGHVTKNVVLDYAKHIDPNLGDWIEKNVSFPNTMVDRIVPAISEEAKAEIQNLLGHEDHCGVISEEFSQWVVEDDFICGRPQWEKVGVQFVDNVLPYEQMKLRMLNGSHSFLAYIGSMMGYAHIDDCMKDSHLNQATKELMLTEQALTLSSSLNVDIEKYAQQLLERFSNPNIKHKTSQIAMDGSQKLPQRAVAPFKQLIAQNQQPRWLPFLIATWMHYVKNETYLVIDPMLDQITQQIKNKKTNGQYVDALLALENIFGLTNTHDPIFTASITSAYNNIDQMGIKQALYHNLKEK